MNLYAYVSNDPLNLSDPTGERPPDEDAIAVRQCGVPCGVSLGDHGRPEPAPSPAPSSPGDSSGQVEAVDVPGLPPVPDSTRDAFVIGGAVIGGTVAVLTVPEGGPASATGGRIVGGAVGGAVHDAGAAAAERTEEIGTQMNEGVLDMMRTGCVPGNFCPSN